MQALEDGGFVKTYEERSHLGAPNRKYYCLSSTFSLTISMSQDSFSIANNNLTKKCNSSNDDDIDNNEQLMTLYKNPKSIPKDSVSNELTSVRKNIVSIENEISDLQSRLNDLQALKQIILRRLHEIGKDNFEHIERKILYRAITAQSSMSISKLAALLNENESHVKDAVSSLQRQLDKDSIRMLFC
jgi:predicted transcriptional regulator